MWPDRLFDTELAARLAGLPRVGLAAVIEQLLGFGLAKEHSAADWSTRPLPEPWLRYAALDVEVLTELREELIELLQADGKLEYAEQEFAAILAAGVAPPRVDPWRKTSGLHQIRDRRQLAAVREMWLERDSLAQKRDVAPGRLIPDSALVVRRQGHAVHRAPAAGHQGLPRPGGAARGAPVAPVHRRCPRLEELPPLHLPTNAPPPPRVWADRDPEAAARLSTARPLLQEKAEELNLPDGEPADAGLPAARGVASARRNQRRGRGHGTARPRRPGVADRPGGALITHAFLNPQPLPPKETKAAAPTD